MRVALDTASKRYQPSPEGIAITEMLSLFQDCDTPQHSRMIGRVQGANFCWQELPVTSIGVLESGDLLVSLNPAPATTNAVDVVRLADFTNLFGLSARTARERLLYATIDGGKTMFVCRGVYVTEQDGAEAYMTFVPADTLPRQTPRHSTH